MSGVVGYELKIGEETDRGSAAYTDCTMQEITVANGATNMQLDFGGVTTADVVYLESDQAISIYLASSGTEIPVRANKPFFQSGTAVTAIYVTNQSGSAAKVKWQIWGDSGASTTPATSDLSTALANTSNASLGDALVGYKASGTDAVGRTVHAVLADAYVNVKDYGAKGDGTTSDCTAILSAWAILTASTRGGTIYFPEGTYRCDAGLDFSSAVYDTARSYTIKGVGRGSQILTHNANISLDLGGRNNVIIEDIEIYDDGTTAKVGMNKQRVVDALGTGHSHVYRNLWILGKYSVASVYSIGVEVNAYYDVYIANYGTGAGYYTSPANSASMTSANAYPASGSNTVNNFYGGTIIGYYGPAVSLGGGVDNLNFYGTYFATINDACPGILFRAAITQGKILLDGVRIETFGVASHGIYMESGVLEVWGLYAKGVHFGLTDAASKDIYWPVWAGGNGLVASVIEDCWHGITNAFSGGIHLQAVMDSRIKVTDYDSVAFSHPAVNIEIALMGSYVEAPNITFSAITHITASKIVKKSKSSSVWQEHYGPNPAFHGSGDALSSAIVIGAQNLAPTTPEIGQISHADGATWDPIGNGQAKSYPVIYNGTTYKSLVGMSSANNSIGGLSYTDANTNEKTLHSLTIPAGTLGPLPYIQVLKIKAAGGTLNNANTKTIRVKLSDGTHTVTVLTNSVTTAPNELAYIADITVTMNSTYASGEWVGVSEIRFNGVAPQIISALYNGGNTLDFSKAVTLSVTGQSGTGTIYDIYCASLFWELVRAQ
jgi:hypothetical protein